MQTSEEHNQIRRGKHRHAHTASSHSYPVLILMLLLLANILLLRHRKDLRQQVCQIHGKSQTSLNLQFTVSSG